MTSRLLTSLSLLLISWQAVQAQSAPADDFFHNGAQSYLSNNIPQAKETVESGLKIYPNDEKLKKLEALLNQQNQSQQQQSQQNQSNQQKSQSQQNQNQQKPDQSQQQKDQQSQNQPNQPKDQHPQPANSAGKQGDEKKDGQEASASAAKEMSSQEAQKLLDAQKGDEQLLQLKPPAKPQDNQKPVKDW